MAPSWTEHRSPTGRLYWYNAQTGTSSWERPDDLKSPAERALASTPWKEYQTAEGRKYWHNTATKETTWTLPDVIRQVIEKVAASAPSPLPPSAPVSAPVLNQPLSLPPASALPAANATVVSAHPTFVPASKSLPQSTPIQPNRPPGPSNPIGPANPAGFAPQMVTLPPRPMASILHSAPSTNQAPAPLPDFKTPEEAERAFIGLLRLKGVNPSWTWEQTMRDIITEPLYKALDTLAARKAAWEKFIDNERKREKENREKNIARVRSSWKAGLDSLGEERTIIDEKGSEIKLPGAPPRLWWTWERLKVELEKRVPEVWKLCRDDEERKVLWDEYLSELRQRDTMVANQLRGRQQEKLTELLRAHEEKLNLPGELETIQWRLAQEAILQSEEFQNDPDLRKMDDLDMLIVFEEEVKRAEKETMELKAKQKDEKRRSCRKTRAAYIQLLHELKLAGEIQAGTMWKEIYPLLEDDPRYQHMLGIFGSSPLDLFWDIIDDLQSEVEEKQKIVEDLLADRAEKVLETTEFDEFLTWLPSDMTPHNIDQPMLKQVFQVLYDRAVRIAKDEKRRAEKRLRNQIEDLRYALKKLSPPITIDASYDEAVSRFSDLIEFKVLEGHDEGRKEAYNRYMERLKEKASIEDKKHRRKEDELHRSDSKKKSSLQQYSDDEESVISSSKKRRKDWFNDDKYHRHLSPRSNRVEDTTSSPRTGGDHRDDRDYHDRYKDSERSRGRGRDYDKEKGRDYERDRERELEKDKERDYDKEKEREHVKERSRGFDRKPEVATDHVLDDDVEKPTSRDRNRSRENERNKSKAKDNKDRSNEPTDDRDQLHSRSATDDRERRRKEYDLDRHGSRHHRSSRRERDHEDRESSKHRNGRFEDEDRHSRDKKSDHDLSEKRARSRDRSEARTTGEHIDNERELKRVKTEELKQDKLTEKSDGEEGELDG